MHAITVTYLGAPTIILEVGGLRLLTDPTLDPAGTTFPTKDNPMYWKTAEPATTDVGEIEVGLLSHDQHGDNLDNAGSELLKTVPKTLTTEVGAERLGGTAYGLKTWEGVNLTDQVSVIGTPARHGPAGVEPLTGEVTGFIVKAGSCQLHITGDTVFYEGVVEVVKRFTPDYVFIFAGAAKPRGPFNLTMSTNDALDTAAAFPRSTIIPLHFEGWSHYAETGDMLQQSFSVLGLGDRLRILEKGKQTPL